MKNFLTAVVVILCAGLTTIPLLTVPAPPISDLPSTAGRIWLEWRLSEGFPQESEQFFFTWPPPYVVQDALVILACRLSRVLPTQILLALDTLVWIVLLFALVRLGCRLTGETGAGMWVIPILASLFRWDFAGQFGNFAWRMGETALILFYILLILESGTRGRAFGFWIAPLVLYFTHVMAFAFWIPLIAVHALVSRRFVVHSVAGCFLPVGYHLIRAWRLPESLHALPPALAEASVDPYRWIPISWEKLSLFGGIYPDTILQGSVYLALAFVVLAAVTRALAGTARPAPERLHLICVSVIAIAAILLPYANRWPGASRTLYLHFANVRALELAALLAAPCAAFVLPAASVIRRRLVLPGLLFLVLAGQTVSLHRYFEWSQELQRIVFGDWNHALLSRRHFYSAVFPSMSGYPALHRYPHYAAKEGVYDPRLFIEEHFWVRPKSPWPVLSLYETRMEAYQDRSFTDFYDDILIVTSPQDPFIPAYASFWKETYPDGSVLTFSPFAHLFRKN